MKFDLKRPCAKCPFRYDVPGYLKRAEEIADAVYGLQQTFSCHATVDYDDDCADGEDGFHFPSEDEQHCAGAAIWLMHMDQPNRIGTFKPDELDMDAPVFDDWYAFIEHHGWGDE